MIKKLTFCAFACSALFTACTETKTSSKQRETTEVQSPKVGGDRDEHGCIGSAGYQWSVVKDSCIRIFEAGIQLKAQKGVDNTFAAYVVFKTLEQDKQAELFLPNAKNVILEKTAAQDAGSWKNADYTLSQYKGMYSLKNKAGKLIYEGMIFPK